MFANRLAAMHTYLPLSKSQPKNNALSQSSQAAPTEWVYCMTSLIVCHPWSSRDTGSSVWCKEHAGDGTAERRGSSVDLRLQQVPGPFSWGRDSRQTCLQKVCPSGGPPAVAG